MTLRSPALAISLVVGCALASGGCTSSRSPKAGLNQLSSSNSARAVVPSSDPATTPTAVTLSAAASAAAPSSPVVPLSSAQSAALGYPPQCAAGGETTASAELNLRNLDPPSATSIQVAVGQVVAVSFPDPQSSQMAKTFPPSVLPAGLVCALGQPGNPTQGVHTILLRTLKPGGANVRWFRSGGAASSPVFTGYLQIRDSSGTTPSSN
jgi:hypothetical protein